MRKILLVGALAALTAPVVAVADNSTPNPKSPAQQCRAERSAMGADNFKNFYGTNKNKSNAFGKCVSKHAQQAQNNHNNAAKACRAEQSDANFAANHGGKTFEQFYGTNPNGHNAFGKCVSQKANQKTADQQQAELNAARTCRAQQRDSNFAADHGGKTFKEFYGTNRNKSNAFGKCVSREARNQT